MQVKVPTRLPALPCERQAEVPRRPLGRPRRRRPLRAGRHRGHAAAERAATAEAVHRVPGRRDEAAVRHEEHLRLRHVPTAQDQRRLVQVNILLCYYP